MTKPKEDIGTMTSNEILATMRVEASEFNFPVLDNANWLLIAGRLRGFRRADTVAVVFEVLVFHTQAQDYTVTVYAYGDLISGVQGHCGVYTVLQELPDSPLWNEEDGEWLAGARIRTVAVRGKVVSALSEEDEAVARFSDSGAVRLSHGDSVDEGAFGRALARELGNDQLMPSNGVLEVLPQLADSKEVIRLSNWDHPDIAGGQQPSDSVAITQLAMLLAREVDSISYDHHADNVSWRHWLLPEG